MSVHSEGLCWWCRKPLVLGDAPSWSLKDDETRTNVCVQCGSVPITRQTVHYNGRAFAVFPCIDRGHYDGTNCDEFECPDCGMKTIALPGRCYCLCDGTILSNPPESTGAPLCAA